MHLLCFVTSAPLRGSRLNACKIRKCCFPLITHQTKRSSSQTKRSFIRCQAGEDQASNGSENESDPKFAFKFDPNSETDAFGRDPRKETEFWMGAAKNVLESEQVQEAINNYAADGSDGLTDEQRAYMEFLKSLDEGASEDQ